MLASIALGGVTRALGIATIAAAITACRGSSAPASPSTLAPVVKTSPVAILGLRATVEQLTTAPAPGLLYRLTYQVHETTGKSGATLITQHFVFSNGVSADGAFSNTPRVAPTATITIESTYSVYPATLPASHVVFSVTYTDDGGGSGSASAEADIS